jgi:hypothetical protein
MILKMELNYSKIFNRETLSSIETYCKVNDIKDIDDFIYRCVKQGFDIKKYGLLGNSLNDGEKHLKIDGIEEKWVEKEVIVEKRVEIPVEVIKEIEKIVEVPVELIKEVIVEKEIIKEVPVEKIITNEIIKEVPVEKVVTKIEYISDKTSENELISKLDEITKDYEQKIFNLNEDLEEERQLISTKTTEMENNFQNEMSKKEQELDELRHKLDIKLDDNKTKMLQDTIQNLNGEIRELKNKIKDLEKQLLDQPKQLGNIPAKFHGSSNLNDGLYR